MVGHCPKRYLLSCTVCQTKILLIKQWAIKVITDIAKLKSVGKCLQIFIWQERLTSISQRWKWQWAGGGMRATSEEERVGSLLFLRYNRTLWYNLDTPKWFTLYTVFQTCLCFFMTWYYELVWSSNVFLTYSLNMGLALLVHFRTWLLRNEPLACAIHNAVV